MTDLCTYKEVIMRSICVLYVCLSISWMAAQNSSGLQITEFMAANEQILADEDGDFSDWIEFYNPTPQAINLEDWYLSDTEDDIQKWSFPALTIEPDGYVLVFASDKDRQSDELHCNFKLASSGEQLILTEPDGFTQAFAVDGIYPQQESDISYGWIGGEWCYMDQPTPGLANIRGRLLHSPSFSVQRGVFDSAFVLTLSSKSEGRILYTLDASLPDSSHGLLYQGPISIDSTMIVRAAVFAPGGRTSKVETHSYLFSHSTISQSNHPTDYPDTWGPFSTIDGLAPADYEMDPEITQASAYKDQMIPALRSLPSISLVSDKAHFFSLSNHPDSGGIYTHTDPPTGGLGAGWERPVSIEYILPENTDRFQVDAGIRIHGGHSRVPEKSPKHSFRLVFRGEYGPKKLEHDFFEESASQTFNSLVLRAGFNQTWIHWNGRQREQSQYINDSWVKDTYRKMGQLAAHNRFVHLYLNGMYWGVYNLSERMDNTFMNSYLTGKESEFDVIKDYAELVDGDLEAWNEMMRIAQDSTSFMRIQGKNEAGDNDPTRPNYLDMENLIDYMILNFYIGNQDWDHHNWVATRNRGQAGKGFQFIPWDSERSFIKLNHNIVEENNEGRPSFLFSQYRYDPRFQDLLLERADELLNAGGHLSPDSVAATWHTRSEEIQLAILAESARWGDYRRDVHPYKSGKYELYTPLDHWEKEQDVLFRSYFPQRSQIVREQLQALVESARLTLIPGEHRSFPNPFSETVSISYHLKKPGFISLGIYDLAGKRVKTLFSGEQLAGQHIYQWTPHAVAQGVYIYRIQRGTRIRSGKLILLH